MQKYSVMTEGGSKWLMVIYNSCGVNGVESSGCIITELIS